ncbi:MAG: competence/damage-inducible protein A [Halofilum sp. (in: g-proteobacteria)]|nr:competence/damage-inducible protein A [Halofilum sp. (in: g-proteobacteria)]
MNRQDPEFGLIVVGDEILAGRRRDGHMAAVIERLGERGLELNWCRIVGDERARLTRTLTETMATDAIVFCCGGIGATPDDVTREAAAEAAGLSIERHPEGEAILRGRFESERLTEHRLRMVDFPAGAALIPNPVNQVPGFQLGRHFFVPGFPKMAWPMIEWVLDHHYGQLVRARSVSHAVHVEAAESDLVPLLERLGNDHPSVRFSSLPNMERRAWRIELGVHGPAPEARAALTALEAALDEAGVARAPAPDEATERPAGPQA